MVCDGKGEVIMEVTVKSLTAQTCPCKHSNAATADLHTETEAKLRAEYFGGPFSEGYPRVFSILDLDAKLISLQNQGGEGGGWRIMRGKLAREERTERARIHSATDRRESKALCRGLRGCHHVS